MHSPLTSCDTVRPSFYLLSLYLLSLATKIVLLNMNRFTWIAFRSLWAAHLAASHSSCQTASHLGS